VLEGHERLDPGGQRARQVVGHALQLVVAARHHVVRDDDAHVLQVEVVEQRVAEQVRLVLGDPDLQRRRGARRRREGDQHRQHQNPAHTHDA
jgi:hypothetical protein